MLERLTTIELFKEYLNFSAAHFTVFSATERERLHGHNFSVYAAITAPVSDNGMTCDYGLYKKKLKALCEALDEYTLIAANSPHLIISEITIDNSDYYAVAFNGEKIHCLQSDTLLLPLRNTTVEEFSHYLLEQLIQDVALLQEYDIRNVVLKVSSGAGQFGSAEWGAESGKR